MTHATTDPKQIFLEAVENHTPETWAAYLDRACGDDVDLRHRVEGLLEAHRQANSLLDGNGIAATAAFGAIAERPGSVIGPYKLMEEIGEGGMGLVFVAEQQHPVRRKVALKVIKPGMDSREIISRFEAERQALALMDHPNIAKVLDAGTTGDPSVPPPSALRVPPSPARPYFVMELVKGVPITEHCDQHQLGTRERLELFLQVCHAVQHAHQKGIIHRDLKPSNVLVTMHDATPLVKVIDFGVAKAIGQQLTDKTLYTGIAQMLGTPLYMSPEQAGQSSLDVDTRSDVYSLGVLLYELLTGTTPFDGETLRKAGFDEMRRIIREVEPPRPSARLSTLQSASLSTLAGNRNVDPHKLSHQLRGELDWIAMKCLEKDRNRRYESAGSLAADALRYLHDETVAACPPALVYRLRKSARRHKGMLTTVFLVGTTLIGGTAVSTWLAVRASVQRNQALMESARLSGGNELFMRHWRSLETEQDFKPVIDSLFHNMTRQEPSIRWDVTVINGPPWQPDAFSNAVEKELAVEAQAGADEALRVSSATTQYVRLVRVSPDCAACHRVLNGKPPQIDDPMAILSLKLKKQGTERD